jgi:hypothetical protein
MEVNNWSDFVTLLLWGWIIGDCLNTYARAKR